MRHYTRRADVLTLLWIMVLFLAFANGANDNAKGVATLQGSGLAGYSVTILWGTAWTFAGAIFSSWIGKGLITLFNGQDLLPANIKNGPDYPLVIAFAAAATVLIASKVGAPISTTHALTGALVGTGAAAFGIDQLHLGILGKKIVLPLVLSPLFSLGLTLLFFPLVMPLQRFAKICICLVQREQALVPGPALNTTLIARPADFVIESFTECRRIGATSQWSPINILHWLSAGLMSFARGLNDTPKIAAILLGGLSGTEEIRTLFAVASAMALGGILGAKRVSRTLSARITPMDAVQGFSANLITSLLVFGASRLGLPVSTTHVACGSLFGIGFLNKKEANWRLVLQILLAWGITLPAAALLGASLYFLFQIAI